jgi:hypothetical protein
MESFGDLQWQVSSAFHSLTGVLKGSFLPPSCGWCHPAWWAAEVGIVGLIVVYFSSHGPKT